MAFLSNPLTSPELVDEPLERLEGLRGSCLRKSDLHSRKPAAVVALFCHRAQASRSNSQQTGLWAKASHQTGSWARASHQNRPPKSAVKTIRPNHSSQTIPPKSPAQNCLPNHLPPNHLVPNQWRAKRYLEQQYPGRLLRNKAPGNAALTLQACLGQSGSNRSLSKVSPWAPMGCNATSYCSALLQCPIAAPRKFVITLELTSNRPRTSTHFQDIGSRKLPNSDKGSIYARYFNHITQDILIISRSRNITLVGHCAGK